MRHGAFAVKVRLDVLFFCVFLMDAQGSRNALRRQAVNHDRLNSRVVQGARLKFDSLRRHGFEAHFNKLFFPRGLLLAKSLRTTTTTTKCIHTSSRASVPPSSFGRVQDS